MQIVVKGQIFFTLFVDLFEKSKAGLLKFFCAFRRGLSEPVLFSVAECYNITKVIVIPS